MPSNFKWTPMLLVLCLSLGACQSTPTTEGVDEALTPSSSTSSTLEKGLKLPGAASNGKAAEKAKVPLEGKRGYSLTLKQPIKGKLKNSIVDSEFDFELSDYSFELGHDSNNDQGENTRVDAYMDLKGYGKHKLSVKGEDYPIMDNRSDQVTITDEEVQNTVIYTADQDLFNYSMSANGETLKAAMNPDGTWMVNGDPAKNIDEVVTLAMKSPVLANASIHGLAYLYAEYNNFGAAEAEFEGELPLEELAQEYSNDFEDVEAGGNIAMVKTPMLMASLSRPTLASPPCVAGPSNVGAPAAPSFGDPTPLLKAILKAKKAQ